MEHIFRKEMLSCDFDNEDALYALFGLPPRTGADDEECLEIQVDVTLTNIVIEYHDGRGWATDGCSKGYVVTDYQETIGAIFEGKRYSLDKILLASEEASLLVDAEDSAIMGLENAEREVW